MNTEVKSVSFEELIVQKRKLDEARKTVEETEESFRFGNHFETKVNKMNEAELYFLTLGRIYYSMPFLSYEDMEKYFAVDLAKFSREKSTEITTHSINAIRRIEEKIAYKEDAERVSYADDSLSGSKIPKLDLTAKQYK